MGLDAVVRAALFMPVETGYPWHLLLMSGHQLNDGHQCQCHAAFSFYIIDMLHSFKTASFEWFDRLLPLLIVF